MAVVDLVYLTSSVIWRLVAHISELFFEVTTPHGIIQRHPYNTSGLQITTHFPVGNDMLITNKHGCTKKKALLIGGSSSKFSKRYTNEMCQLIRDELHWPSVLVNYQTPNTPTVETIQKSLEWLADGVSSSDTLFLYYCGSCYMSEDCTITVNGGSIHLLKSLLQLLGPNKPNVLMIMDVCNLKMTSLPYTFTRQSVHPTRLEAPQSSQTSVACLATDNRTLKKVGQLTKSIVQLMHQRHLRLSLHQVLQQVQSDDFELVVKCSEMDTKLDRILIGVEF